MDPVDTTFYAPMMLRLLCYLSGMAVFVNTLLWLRRRVLGVPQSLKLSDVVGLSFMRVLLACVFLSLGLAVFSFGAEAVNRNIVPELSILCLSAALYLFFIKERPLSWRSIISKRLLRELGQIVITVVFSVAGWGVSIGLGLALLYVFNALGAASWVPIFVIGLVWNAPLILLFLKGQREGRFESLKFHHLLWPVLLAYFLLMVPDMAENFANNPKVHEMMDPSPPIIQL